MLIHAVSNAPKIADQAIVMNGWHHPRTIPHRLPLSRKSCSEGGGRADVSQRSWSARRMAYSLVRFQPGHSKGTIYLSEQDGTAK